jgi:hypothetical protein
MCNKELLIGYVYDELSPGERATFEAHLAACDECREEIGGLRQARQHLSSWSPPEPALAFHIIRGPVPVARRPLAFVPQWALAAAATILLLAGAAAIAHVEIRYDANGVAVRTGWSSTGAPEAQPQGRPPVEPVQAAAADTASEQLKAEVAALQQRIEQMEEAQAKQLTQAAASIRPGVTTPELRKILAESEARQRTELAVHVAQIWKDFNGARTSDLVRVQEAISRAQGVTNYQLTQQRNSIDMLRANVAARPQ